MFNVGSFTAVTDQDKTRLDSLLDYTSKYFDAINRTLDRTKVGNVDQQWLVLWRQRSAQCFDWVARVVMLTNKVRDYLDVVEIENFFRRSFQVMRNGRNTV